MRKSMNEYEQLSLFDMLDSSPQVGDCVYFTTCNEVRSGKLESGSTKQNKMCRISVNSKDIWHVKPECVYHTKSEAAKHIRDTGYAVDIVYK